MKKQKKCYIYTRVSTAIQVDGYSLDAQKDKLRKYAKYQDMTIVEEFSDEGHSGKNIKGRPEFVRMMEKIGTAVDTSEMEERIKTLRGQLKQVSGTKTRLEHQMDNLDVSDPHYDKKVSDLQRRYDEQYDKAEAIETQIDEINTQMLSIRQEKISADNVYQLLLSFDKLYNTFAEVEQRDFMRSFIERIDIYPEKPENGCWIRNIVFNFSMPVQGQKIKSLPLESKSTVETVVLLGKITDGPKDYVKIGIDVEDYYKIKDVQNKQRIK